MAKTVRVELACAACGSALFALPHNSPRPDDIVTCAECGEYIGPYETVRGTAKQACQAQLS
jgi:hypothetical protein